MILTFSEDEENILNVITRLLADKTEILDFKPEKFLLFIVIGIEIFTKDRKVKFEGKE